MEEKTLNQDLENKEVEAGKTPEETPKKKKGIKGFLQLVFFIVLSMAGFIVQLLIKTFGVKIGFIKELDADVSKNFNLFGLNWLETQLGTFIVVMIGIFLCKLINFILHRKVLFKPRHNLAFGIFMYVLFSVALWAATTIVDQPLTNAIYNSSVWTDTIFKGNKDTAKSIAGIVAMVTYSCADLIIMFFAEKFLIMNDKLFGKNRKEQVAVDSAATSSGEQAVAADIDAQDAINAAPIKESADEEIKDDYLDPWHVEQQEVAEEKADVAEVQVETEPIQETTVEEVAEVEVQPAEVTEVEVQPAEEAEAEEEQKPAEEAATDVEMQPIEVEEAVAEVVEEPEAVEAEAEEEVIEKKAPAKKSATAKKTTATAKKPAAKTAATKTTAAKTATAAKKPAAKTTATKSAAAKKPTAATAKKTAATKTSAAKSTAAKTSAAKKPATTAKTTAAKTATAAKKTTATKTSAAKKPATTAAKKPATATKATTAAKKPTAAKTAATAKKPAAKTTAAKTSAAKKPAAKSTAKKK